MKNVNGKGIESIENILMRKVTDAGRSCCVVLCGGCRVTHCRLSQPE